MKSKIYEILDHTADVKFRVYGSTIESLIKNICITFSDFICEKCDNNIISSNNDFNDININSLNTSLNKINNINDKKINEKEIEKETLKYREHFDDFIFDFISDLIYLFDSRELIPKDVVDLNVNLNNEDELLNNVNVSIEIKIQFCRCIKIKHDVKAMTYNDLKVVYSKEQNTYIAEFVLDI